MPRTTNESSGYLGSKRNATSVSSSPPPCPVVKSLTTNRILQLLKDSIPSSSRQPASSESPPSQIATSLLNSPTQASSSTSLLSPPTMYFPRSADFPATTLLIPSRFIPIFVNPGPYPPIIDIHSPCTLEDLDFLLHLIADPPHPVMGCALWKPLPVLGAQVLERVDRGAQRGYEMLTAVLEEDESGSEGGEWDLSGLEGEEGGEGAEGEGGWELDQLEGDGGGEAMDVDDSALEADVEGWYQTGIDLGFATGFPVGDIDPAFYFSVSSSITSSSSSSHAAEDDELHPSNTSNGDQGQHIVPDQQYQAALQLCSECGVAFSAEEYGASGYDWLNKHLLERAFHILGADSSCDAEGFSQAVAYVERAFGTTRASPSRVYEPAALSISVASDGHSSNPASLRPFFSSHELDDVSSPSNVSDDPAHPDLLLTVMLFLAEDARKQEGGGGCGDVVGDPGALVEVVGAGEITWIMKPIEHSGNLARRIQSGPVSTASGEVLPSGTQTLPAKDARVLTEGAFRVNLNQEMLNPRTAAMNTSTKEFAWEGKGEAGRSLMVSGPMQDAFLPQFQSSAEHPLEESSMFGDAKLQTPAVGLSSSEYPSVHDDWGAALGAGEMPSAAALEAEFHDWFVGDDVV